MNFQVIPYTPDREADWDRFVMKESANGTFLQSWRFLGYHPADRFQETPLLVVNEKGAIAAAVPGAVVDREGKRTFVSHPGSTYGGPVIRETYRDSEHTMGIMAALEEYLAARYDRAELKLTPPIFCGQECETLDFALYYQGWRQWMELSTWVPLEGKEDLIATFRQNKKQDVRKALRFDTVYRRLETPAEIAEFHALLTENLKKFNAAPIHTVDDLLLLANDRLPEETSFYGVFEGERLVAGSMLFYFAQTNVLHTQYLASDYGVSAYRPAALLYYHTLETGKAMGCRAVSWGISTEDHGSYLNLGLVNNKEGYGSLHAINRTYYKDF